MSEFYIDNDSDDSTPLNARFILTVNNIAGEILTLEKENKYLISDKNSECKYYESDLPDFVAAWLTILYDIIEIESSQLDKKDLESTISTINYGKGQNSIFINPLYINLTHEILFYSKKIDINVRWTTPEWPTFWVNDIFHKRWNNYLLKYKDDLGMRPSSELIEELSTGWIKCVLATYFDLTSNISNNKKISELNQKNKQADTFKDVIKNSVNIYSYIQGEQKQKGNYDDEIALSLRNWMEQELPLFLSYYYVPLSSDETDKRFKSLNDINIKESKLNKYWARNSGFILADIRKNIEELFSSSITDEKNNQELEKIRMKEMINLLVGNLERYLK